MHTVTNVLVALIGIEHLGIMFLEIFAHPDIQAHSFELPVSDLKQQTIKTLLANQGIYNGMLGLTLLATLGIANGAMQNLAQLMLLLFVAVMGFFGGLTATKKIWLIQLTPALITIFFLLI